jgi:predicted permease
MKGIRRLFGFSGRAPRDIDADVADEFAFHLDMRAADLVREGHTPEAARAIAAREFGDAAAAAAHGRRRGVEVERRRWLARIASDLAQDLGYGWRLATRTRGFSATAILTLAVAIGGNTAVFSILDALLFKPAPVADPASLVRVFPGESQIAWLNYRDLLARNHVFTDLAASRGLLLSSGDDRLVGDAVTANFFTVLGVAAGRGRTILPSDTRADLVVLSDRCWRTRFAADPSIVGRRIPLDGRPFEVLGVMPPSFRGIAPAGLVRDFWTSIDPAAAERRFADRTATNFAAIARLAPGVSRQQAAAELAVLAAQIRGEHPEVPETFTAMSLSGFDGVGALRGMRGALLPVFGFVALMALVAGFVLLIGCANIAGLLLSRATMRRREIAVRLALGAGRGRLVRQLMTESLVLAAIGGAGGIVLATWIAGSANRMLAQLPFAFEFDLGLDYRVVAYTIGLSLFTALVFGLSPARRAARIDLVPALKDESTSRASQRLRSVMLVAQVAICSVLLVWGGLFARSLGHVSDIDPGFDPSGVLVADIDLGDQARTDAQRDAIFVGIQQRLSALPGVEATGLAWAVPLALMSNQRYGVFTEADDQQGAARRVMGNSVTPGWLATVRIPLVAGRDFTWDDRDGSPKVAIVNEVAARRFWNGTAVGRQLTIPSRTDTWETVTVVGVAGNSKYWTLGETIEPLVYLPVRQRMGNGCVLHVRGRDDRAAAEAVRAEVRAHAPGATVEIKPMADAVAVAIMPARVGAIFTTGFGAVAMLLAAMGLYGLVAFTVASRTREFVVRRAIGARSNDIVRLVALGTATLVAIGLALGTALGILGAHALGGFIVGVAPADPLTLAAVAALVILSAAAASALPTWRATRVDPLVAMRTD